MNLKEKIDFYLNPLEFLNKPRRVFMGLEYLLDQVIKDGISNFENKELRKEENELVREIIKQAKIDFYEYTFPKFEKRVKDL